VLCSLLWVTLLGQRVGLGDPQRSLLTPAVLGFCDAVYQGAGGELPVLRAYPEGCFAGVGDRLSRQPRGLGIGLTRWNSLPGQSRPSFACRTCKGEGRNPPVGEQSRAAPPQ